MIPFAYIYIYTNYITYPPWGKCEALRLGVHLILLYFIRILVVGTEIIFLFWCGCGCGCGWQTFFVFKSLNKNMVYISGINVYVCKRNRCTTKVLWVLKFCEVGGQDFFFKITAGRTVFNFSCKTSFFCSRQVFFLSKGREFVLQNKLLHEKSLMGFKILRSQKLGFFF